MQSCHRSILFLLAVVPVKEQALLWLASEAGVVAESQVRASVEDSLLRKLGEFPKYEKFEIVAYQLTA